MEDLKQAVIASQAEDAALGTLYSRYYTAMRYRTPTGPAIRAVGAKDRGEAQAALRLAGGVGIYKAGDFIEGIVYDTALRLSVYHQDAKTLLLDAIQRECEKLMTACGTPEQLACIGVMLHKLHLLRDFVSPPLEAKGGVGGSAKKTDKI